MDAQHYQNVADKYLRCLTEKDLEGILSLYADDASVEDPVGSEVLSGMDKLREFYTKAMGIKMKAERTGPVRIAGSEAAFPFQLQMDMGSAMKMDIIDVFRFDEAGKILSMRAFWGPDNCGPVA